MDNETQNQAEGKPLTDVEVQLTGEDGNSFFILGKVSKALKKAGHADLATKFMAEATQGDYDNLLRTAMKYVEVL
jgi:hypothetical protein